LNWSGNNCSGSSGGSAEAAVDANDDEDEDHNWDNDDDNKETNSQASCSSRNSGVVNTVGGRKAVASGVRRGASTLVGSSAAAAV